MTPHERGRRLRIRRIRITGWTALTSLVVTLVGFLTYFHIVFPADRAATLEVFRDSRVRVEASEGRVVMEPTGESTGRGILYFPGARVDPYSYLYPFADLVAAGNTLVVVDPLMNMALFDPRGLGELTADFSDISTWVVAGHSLGGVKACLEVDNPAVSDLVLMGSFCANDISALDIGVIQIVADRDGLIDESSRRDAEKFLPAQSRRTMTLEGANHASFGTYGPQPGDGTSTLSAAEVRVSLTDILNATVFVD
ncbi:MAG: alpha/beta hydrolase [Microbacteriaceae bacterium]|nr:alpha/beta hydrolase [Microbacteriaceae bacterium]